MINLLKQLLDWIYRRKCYLCRKPCEIESICNNCYEEIDIASPDSIRIIDEVNVYSMSIYTGNLRKIIKGLKYHRQKHLAETLAKLLYSYWNKTELSNKKFEIVPMPLYPEREKQRDYNHMILVAREFSKLTGYQVNTEIVKRIKNTKPQYKLSKRERMENMENAFKAFPEKYTKRSLLLLDDICTSGTTLQELIKTLKRNEIFDLQALVISNPDSSAFF